MRGLLRSSAVALLFAAGVAGAQESGQPVSPQSGQPPASVSGEGTDVDKVTRATGQKSGDVSDIKGGKGNPTSDQIVGPPNAGSVPLRGDGLDLPGASPQTAPAKYSAENAKMLDYSIMGFPVQLSAEQKNEILKAIGNRSATASGLGKTIHAEAGVFLPPEVAAEELPGSLNQQIPQLRGLKYVKTNDKILLIAPDNGIVRGVIEE